ncbi:surface protein, putative [Trichomonas vaginalis G3]|uniref:Surface protein, putative n=1 Tax=Trichomonas vaginalis (strain ATCC PRA-98 / G3) TaxID=412133 RepID=A2DQF0_TRIV3|nr:LP07818P1 family [Trichomonas vaginalis G3]EAY17407.1 surface protein, putative [Trichomonas vaginalis G3]KAI5491417.1 LP07818P1 family [Trichomonas vaginalis G3]|eukprot:XP_001330776.1 surface protein [Trichomonas vaginalis G3]
MTIQAIGPFLFFYQNNDLKDMVHIVFVPTSTNGLNKKSKGAEITIDSLGKVFMPISIVFQSFEDMKAFQAYFNKLFAETIQFYEKLTMYSFQLSEQIEEIFGPKEIKPVMAILQIVSKSHHFQALRLDISELKPFTEKLTNLTLVYPESKHIGKTTPAHSFVITDLNHMKTPHTYLCKSIPDMMKWVLAIYITANAPESSLIPPAQRLENMLNQNAPAQPAVVKSVPKITVQTTQTQTKKPVPQETPKSQEPPKQPEPAKPAVAPPKPPEEVPKPAEPEKPKSEVQENKSEQKTEKTEPTQQEQPKTEETPQPAPQPAPPKPIFQITIETQPPPPPKKEQPTPIKKPLIITVKEAVSPTKSSVKLRKLKKEGEQNKQEENADNEQKVNLPPEVIAANYQSKPLDVQLNGYLETYSKIKKKSQLQLRINTIDKSLLPNSFKYDEKFIETELEKICENFDKIEPNYDLSIPMDTVNPDQLVESTLTKLSGNPTINLSSIFDWNKFGIQYDIYFSEASPKCPITTQLSICSQNFYASGNQIQSDTPDAFRFVFLVASIFLNGLIEDSLVEPIKELALQTPELTSLVPKLFNISDVIKQATTMAAILINDKDIGSVLRSILRIDNWSEQYYKKTAMMRNETSLEEALMLIDSIVNSQSFIINPEANIMSDIPACDKTRFIDTPIFSYLDFDEYKTNPSKMAESILTNGILQKKNFLQQYYAQDPFDCISEVVEKLQDNEITNSFISTVKKIQGTSVLDAMKTSKVLDAIKTTKLSTFIDEGVKTMQMYKWLCILVANHSIISNWYEEEAILYDFFRAKFVISQIYQFEKGD